MGCQNSVSRLNRSLGPFISTSVPELDALYERADLTLLAFHKDCGSMLTAMDTFETVSGGSRGLPGTVAKSLIATLIAVIGDLESSGLPARPCRKMPGLEIAQHALTHEESKRAWILWESLSGELMLMVKGVEKYFPHANECAGLMSAAERIVGTLTNNIDIRVIDLRKLMIVTKYNNDALLISAAEFHTTISRIKSTITEALIVLEALQKSRHLSRMKELGSAAAKIQAFDPLLVMEHFESGIKEFLREVMPS